jgi:VanZ family protein
MSERNGPPARWRWWWPAIAMMAIIFIGSTDLGAMSHQSRLLLPLLRWFGFGETAIHGIILAIRKLAHLTEYALLAIFVWRAWMLRPVFRPPVAWHWSEALLPFLICVGYALLDEFHQSFVPSRGASIWDVLIDVCGAVIGLALLWRWHRARLARGSG